MIPTQHNSDIKKHILVQLVSKRQMLGHKISEAYKNSFLISNTSLTEIRTKKTLNPIKEEFKAKRTKNKI